MPGIDIKSIQSNIPNSKSVLQKLAMLLLKKVTESETLIQTPLNNLIKQLPTDGTCPDSTMLQNVLTKRNNIVGFLNKFGKFLDTIVFTYTGLSVAFDVLLNTIVGLNLAKSIASLGVKFLPSAPGFVTALLSDIGDTTNKLTFDSLGESKLLKKKADLDNLAIVLGVVSTFVKTVIGILNSLDSLIGHCLSEDQKSQLVSINENLIKIVDIEKPSPNIYQGFIIEIEEVPFSNTVTRRKAVALNQSGIKMLETELSFTTNNQTLIDELQLIIDRDNLKAY